jgi:ATP:cob(I)alamin adenosyltransferase
MRKIDTLCYTHIYEDAVTCDWEIASDLLACELGVALALAEQSSGHWAHPGREHAAFVAELADLQRKVYDANGSIRGRSAIDDEQVRELFEQYQTAQAQVGARSSLFVLPGGTHLASQLHVCRCRAKGLVRLLHRHGKETGPVPASLLKWTNLLSNHLFVLAQLANQALGRTETPYESPNYPVGGRAPEPR